MGRILLVRAGCSALFMVCFETTDAVVNAKSPTPKVTDELTTVAKTSTTTEEPTTTPTTEVPAPPTPKGRAYNRNPGKDVIIDNLQPFR